MLLLKSPSSLLALLHASFSDFDSRYVKYFPTFKYSLVHGEVALDPRETVACCYVLVAKQLTNRFRHDGLIRSDRRETHTKLLPQSQVLGDL